MQSGDDADDKLTDGTSTEDSVTNASPEAACPFCGSRQVKQLSQFGKAQLVRQYYCLNCKSPFERLRWIKGGM